MISDKDRAAYKALGVLTVLYRWGLLPDSLRSDVREIMVMADGEESATEADNYAAIMKVSADEIKKAAA